MTNPRPLNRIYGSFYAGAVLFLALLAACSCNRLPDPAFSHYPEDEPEAGDTLFFMNETRFGDNYRWEFGDGNFSMRRNPSHVYQEAGIYRVKLMAVNDAGENSIEQTLTIFEPTILTLIVFDSTGTRSLSGAGVSVYDDRDRFLEKADPLLFTLTDTSGRCAFRNVEPADYYIRAIREENNGYWGKEGRTGALEEHRTSIFRILCTWTEEAPAAGP